MNKQKKRPKRSRRFSGVILVCMFLIVLPSAGQGWTAPSSPLPPLNYSYHALGKPDPFIPFVEKELSRKKVKNRKRTKPLSIFPLQRASVGQFKLIGIAGNEQGRTAMVTNAQGRSFPVFVGTVIGLHGGQVAQILEDRVIVEEKATSGKGRHKTRRISLKLQNVD